MKCYHVIVTVLLLDVITRFAVQWATEREFPWGTPNLADVVTNNMVVCTVKLFKLVLLFYIIAAIACAPFGGGQQRERRGELSSFNTISISSAENEVFWCTNNLLTWSFPHIS